MSPRNLLMSVAPWSSVPCASMTHQTSAADVTRLIRCSIAVQVDGDHRVGIFARKDLPAGSELFYNYRWVTQDAACASSRAAAARTARNDVRACFIVRYEEASAPRWCKHFKDLNPDR